MEDREWEVGKDVILKMRVWVEISLVNWHRNVWLQKNGDPIQSCLYFLQKKEGLILSGRLSLD